MVWMEGESVRVNNHLKNEQGSYFGDLMFTMNKAVF